MKINRTASTLILVTIFMTSVKGFGATYRQTGENAFMLNPSADKDSLV